LIVADESVGYLPDQRNGGNCGMRWLVRLVAAIVALGAILALVGLVFLPRHVAVSRSIEIAAPPAVVWPFISDLRRFNEWSAWAAIDPDGTTYIFEGPDTGVGQTMRWSSEHPNVGSGTQEVVAVDPGRSIDTRLDFGDMGTAEATLTVVSAGTGSEVDWGFSTDLGMNPITRWFGLMFDSWVGNDYETGLENLKALAEQKAGTG
jgi:uncharacterized protein YndB with AHSA1/START domain